MRLELAEVKTLLSRSATSRHLDLQIFPADMRPKNFAFQFFAILGIHGDSAISFPSLFQCLSVEGFDFSDLHCPRSSAAKSFCFALPRVPLVGFGFSDSPMPRLPDFPILLFSVSPW